jgi:hypothetical protein
MAAMPAPPVAGCTNRVQLVGKWYDWAVAKGKYVSRRFSRILTLDMTS